MEAFFALHCIITMADEIYYRHTFKHYARLFCVDKRVDVA